MNNTLKIMLLALGIAVGFVLSSLLPNKTSSSGQVSDPLIVEQALQESLENEKIQRKAYAKEEQLYVFHRGRQGGALSICSPDGVAYWSKNASTTSQSWSFAPRINKDGKPVLCDPASNEILPGEESSEQVTKPLRKE